MALYGALDTNPWQVRDAVHSGLAMREALSDYNERLKGRGQPQLVMGMGIHHGPVVAGIIGADDFVQFDVYGDVVNVASRVQTLTRDFEADLLVSDVVMKQLDDSFEARSMPATKVKGKSDPIRTFAIDGANNR